MKTDFFDYSVKDLGRNSSIPRFIPVQSSTDDNMIIFIKKSNIYQDFPGDKRDAYALDFKLQAMYSGIPAYLR